MAPDKSEGLSTGSGIRSRRRRLHPLMMWHACCGGDDTIYICLMPQQVCAKMVKAMGLYELPSLLWHLPDAQRREFMKQVCV